MDDLSRSEPASDVDPAGEPTTVVRSVDLDCELDVAWGLVATAEGLDRWLGTDARLDPVAGGIVGVRDDGGALRTGRVVEVDEGRSLVFEWAEVGDAASRSTVTLTVEGDGDGTSRVTVEERRAGGLVACCADAGSDWDGRLLSLELDVLVAGPLGRHLTVAA